MVPYFLNESIEKSMDYSSKSLISKPKGDHDKDFTIFLIDMRMHHGLAIAYILFTQLTILYIITYDFKIRVIDPRALA